MLKDAEEDWLSGNWEFFWQKNWQPQVIKWEQFVRKSFEKFGTDCSKNFKQKYFDTFGQKLLDKVLYF